MDVALGLIVLLAAYAAYSRGLPFALADAARAAAALAAALVGYSLTDLITGAPVAGLAVGAVLGLGLFGLSELVVKRMGEGPSWNRRFPSRLAAALVGIPMGIAFCFFFLPVAARFEPVARAAEQSSFGRALLDRLPAMYDAADVIGLRLPRFESGTLTFADEHATGQTGLSERMNFRSLDGATCVECGAPVSFRGYRRTGSIDVSPLFVCPACGRQSDGCQTFEGFHRMYDLCPGEVAGRDGEISCGVWPNERPVQPKGTCPVCGWSGR